MDNIPPPTAWTLFYSDDVVRKLSSPAFAAPTKPKEIIGSSASWPTPRDNYNDKKIGTIAVDEAENGPATPPRTKGRTTLIMIALCLAVFLAALDLTIVTTALPTIAVEFKATEADYTWIGSSYMLAAAATTPCWGTISDIFGRKPIVVLANAIFIVGSLVCALSVNLPMLLAGRVFSGIGAGGLIALPTICISDMFSVRKRGLYFALTGLMWALAGSVGPIIGGALTQYATWRWVFWINLPIDGVTLVALILFLNVHNPKTPLIAGLLAVDWFGIVLIVASTSMFLVGLNFGGVTYPWSSPVVVLLILFGILALLAFVFVERNFAKVPIMPPMMFRDRSNIAALTLAFIHGFVYIANSYFLPQYFQIILGASPLLSGLYLMPYIFTLCLIGSMTGYFIKVTGYYLPAIYVGMTFVVFGQGLYIDLQPYTSLARIVLFQFLVGLGTGPVFQALIITLHSGVGPRDTAAASSTYNFTRNIGTALSVVIGGTIFQNGITARQETLEAVLPALLLAQFNGVNAGGSLDIIKTLSAEQQLAVKEVYTDSLRTVWIFYTCVAALGLLCCIFLKKRVLSTTHIEHKTGLNVEKN